MIIYLDKSNLFSVDPSKRFAREYGVSDKLWTEVWRRHTLLSYTNSELCEFLHIKTGKRPNRGSVRRWIIRTEIYCLGNHLARMGVRVVTSEYFGQYESEVIKEFTKGMRYGGQKDARNIV